MFVCFRKERTFQKIWERTWNEQHHKHSTIITRAVTTTLQLGTKCNCYHPVAKHIPVFGHQICKTFKWGPSFRHPQAMALDRFIQDSWFPIFTHYSQFILHYCWVYLHGPHESFCGSKMIKAAKIHGIIKTSARLYLYVKRQCCHLSLKVCHWLSGRKEANGQSATQDSVASQHGEIAKTFGYHEIDWRILKAMLPKSRCLPLGAFLNTSSGRGVNLQDLRDLSWETYPVPNDITDLVDWSIICHLIFCWGLPKKTCLGASTSLETKGTSIQEICVRKSVTSPFNWNYM